MYGYHVAGIFATYDAAEDAKLRIIRAGVPEKNIHLSHDSPYEEDRPQAQGFWDWMFGGGSSRRDEEWYRNNLTGGRTAVSVLVPDDHDHIWVAEQLIAAGALDLEDEEDDTLTAGTIRERRAAPRTETRRERTSGEQVIPIEREELDIGKRATENRYRVRAHTVEHPVERDINLREERFVVERRPSTGPARSGPGKFEDRDFEVAERHEEPVVNKRTVGEEAVIRKETQDRTAKVRDKVRETELDVDREADRPRSTAGGRIPRDRPRGLPH
ncbi:MAG: YsnF/AvaK domain-containing protein [Rhodomicrobium sp.]